MYNNWMSCFIETVFLSYHKLPWTIWLQSRLRSQTWNFSVFDLKILCLQSRPTLLSNWQGELAVTRETRLGDLKLVFCWVAQCPGLNKTLHFRVGCLRHSIYWTDEYSWEKKILVLNRCLWPQICNLARSWKIGQRWPEARESSNRWFEIGL